jgi:uncharacterized protein (DUF983 family)
MAPDPNTDAARRPLWPAMKRGFACQCPRCGAPSLFSRFLVVADHCRGCGAALHHQRADDAPPYFTMFIVGHVVIALLLLVERRYQPDVWLHLALWLPLTVGLSLWLLPRIKGALVAQQWALRMHGFGREMDGIDRPEAWAGDTVARTAPRRGDAS